MMPSLEQRRYHRGKELRAALTELVKQVRADFPEFRLTVICRNIEDDRGHSVAIDGDMEGALDLYEYALFGMAQGEARAVAGGHLADADTRYANALTDRLQKLIDARQPKAAAE